MARPAATLGQRVPGGSLSQLIVFALVSFSQHSVLPWILIFFQARKYEAWSQVTIVYGLLITTLNSGVFVGQLTAGRFSQLSLTYYASLFIGLTIAYVAVTLVSRFFFIILLFWMMGFCGGMLTSFSLAVDGRLPIIFQKKASEQGGAALDRTVVCFSFSTLLTAFLYDNSDSSQFPCFYLALVMTAGCVMCGAYFFFLSRTSEKRSAPPVLGPGISGKEGSGAPAFKLSTNDADLAEAGADYGGPVPINFLSSCQGNLAKARKMYGKMLAWRRKYRVDDISSIPQPSFQTVVKYYPHAVHGFSLDGCAVVYELLGRGRAKELKSSGITIDELVWHFNLRNEVVMRRVLAPDALQEAIRAAPPGAISAPPFPYTPEPSLQPHIIEQSVPRLMTVIDVSGISMYSITTDVLAFIQRSGETIDMYYPEQVARLVVCNAPRWFSTIWSVIARVLPEAVQNKVDIMYDAQGLDKFIHPSQRPKEYGGTDVELGMHPANKTFLAVCEEWRRAEELQAKQQGNLTLDLAVVNEAKTPVPTSPAAPHDAKKSPNWMGWLRNRFQRVTPEAFLGDKNSYRYNAATGRWEMDVDGAHDELPLTADDNSRRPSAVLSRSHSQAALPIISSPRPGLGGRSTSMKSLADVSYGKDHLEEHGLVLAIQAAHYASKMKRSTSAHISTAALNALAQPSPSLVPENTYGLGAMEALAGSANDYREGVEGGEAQVSPQFQPITKLSAHIFLAVLSIFVVTSCLQVSTLALLPVWLASPLRSGGLGFGVRDLALLMSATGVVVLHVSALLAAKMESLLRSSPVRALRIGCGVLFVALFVLPRYMRRYTLPIEDILHHHHDHELAHSAHHRFSSSLFGALAAEAPMLTQLCEVLPSISLLALVVPALLVAAVVCASHLCRRAACIMLHLSLSSTFSSPTTVRNALNAMVDILCPLLSALLSSIVYGARVKYPMDSSFFLPLGACSILLAYLASLFLEVQFRGDFGVMSDYQDALLWGQIRSEAPTEVVAKKESNRLLKRGMGRDHSDSSFGTPVEEESEEENGGSLLAGALTEYHVLTIPLGDLNLLFSGMGGHGYGHRLHNLKDDFKDV